MTYIELQKNIETIADEIISLYEQFGSEDYIGLNAQKRSGKYGSC